MKTLALSAVIATTLATTASAGDVFFTGSTEYAIEAETVDLNLGLEVFAGAFTFAPSADFAYVDEDGTFEGLNLDMSYTLTSNLDAYLELDLDEDVEYQEATVGVAFRF